VISVFYSDDYLAAASDFDTLDKAGWMDDSLRADPIAGTVLTAPEQLSA
jgi:hypothetical protein